MKQKFYLSIILLLMMITSCSKKQEPIVTAESNIMLDEPKPLDSSATVSQKTSEVSGLELIEKSDCLTCHKVDTKVIGPSYQDVAKKYTDDDIDLLSKKIINGGKGNWGEIAMSPHEGLSKEDAQKMVKYILSLKK